MRETFHLMNIPVNFNLGVGILLTTDHQFLIILLRCLCVFLLSLEIQFFHFPNIFYTFRNR